jgi:hypothetical protein
MTMKNPLKIETTELPLIPKRDQWFFNWEEFIIAPEDHVPLYVLNMIYWKHMVPLNAVRIALNDVVIISKKSCFRSVAHETRRKRKLTSAHLFGTQIKDLDTSPKAIMGNRLAWGASDITTKPPLMKELFILLSRTPYTRIIYYPNEGFFHGDYRTEQRHYYVYDSKKPPMVESTFEKILEMLE